MRFEASSHIWRRMSLFTAMLFLSGASVLLRAQSNVPVKLGPGSLLVASRELEDPNFVNTVVLLVRYDEEEEGVVGLIINRQTHVTLAQAFEGIKGSEGRTDPVFAGGPVGRNGILALVRSHTRIADSDHVFPDVHLVSRKTQLEKLLTGRAEPATFRAYVGYAGWTVPQLMAEIEIGAWHVLAGQPDLVFDANPDGLWRRLIRETELQVADLRTPTLLTPAAAANGSASIASTASHRRRP